MKLSWSSIRGLRSICPCGQLLRSLNYDITTRKKFRSTKDLREKFWTHEKPAWKNFWPKKNPRRNIFDPRNTNKKNFWSHETPTKKAFAFIKYIRGKILNPQNTHEKKFRIQEIVLNPPPSPPKKFLLNLRSQ